MGSFDLAGLGRLLGKLAIEHAEKKTSMEFAPLVNPIMEKAIDHFGLGIIEIDPIFMGLGKVVVSGIARQRAISEAVRASREVKEE